MKDFFSDFRVKLFGCFLLLSALVVTAAFLFMQTHEPKRPHKYVQAIVTEKYIVPGYGSGGIYGGAYKPTEYIIVCKYVTPKGEFVATISAYIEDYNAIEVGDYIPYCVEHDKPKMYE